jgi:nicotinamidase/pyrazinamidase
MKNQVKVAGRRPGMPHKILIVVDTQMDFVMRWGLLSVAGAEAIIVPGVGILANLDANEYAAVLFTYDTHVAYKYLGSLENVGQPEFGIPAFRLHCELGTPGWENVFNPAAVPSAIAVYESRKSVFDWYQAPSAEVKVTRVDADRASGEGGDAEYDRDGFLGATKARGVTTATVIGVASDFCVKDQIRGLLEAGFEVEVIAEATAGILRDIATTIAEDFPGRVAIVEAGTPVAPPAQADADGLVPGESGDDFQARHRRDKLKGLTPAQRDGYLLANAIRRGSSFVSAVDRETGRRGRYHFAEHMNLGAGWMMADVDRGGGIVSSFSLRDLEPVDWTTTVLPTQDVYRLVAEREMAKS